MKKTPVVYVIHGQSVEDCIRIQKDNNLTVKECVHVLAGYETGLERDTDTIKHIWGKIKCPRCGNNILSGKPCPYCIGV